jgi:hypothetical protein
MSLDHILNGENSQIFDKFDFDYEFHLTPSYRWSVHLKRTIVPKHFCRAQGQFPFNGYRNAYAIARFEMNGAPMILRMECDKDSETVVFELDWKDDNPPWHKFQLFGIEQKFEVPNMGSVTVTTTHQFHVWVESECDPNSLLTPARVSNGAQVGIVYC